MEVVYRKDLENDKLASLIPENVLNARILFKLCFSHVVKIESMPREEIFRK